MFKEGGKTMGFVSDILDKTDDCVKLYNFLFVDYQIGKINNEMNYLDSIRDNAEQIRYYFLNCASTMNMPLKVLYIQNVMQYSDMQLKERLEQMYQILEIRKNQIMHKKINAEPIKVASNVCKIVEEVQNYNTEYRK